MTNGKIILLHPLFVKHFRDSKLLQKQQEKHIDLLQNTYRNILYEQCLFMQKTMFVCNKIDTCPVSNK